MIPTPIHTVITGVRDLMLIPPEEETIDDIKETIEPIIGVYGHQKPVLRYRPHRKKTLDQCLHQF